MEMYLTEENGTWKVPWEQVMSADDRANLMLVERLRYMDLQRVASDSKPGVDLQWETMRYDDDNLYLDVHTSYPVIMRMRYRDKGAPDGWDWYTIQHRGGGFVVFDEIHCFKVSVERSGFEEPVLWG